MRQLTRFQLILMAIGGTLMVAGIVAELFTLGMPPTQPLAIAATASFVLGTFIYAAMMLLQTYDGTSLTIKRLCRIRNFSAVCLIFSGLLMIEQTFHLLLPLFNSNIDSMVAYYQIVRNNWVLLLLIAAILQLYTTLRLSKEMAKEKR